MPIARLVSSALNLLLSGRPGQPPDPPGLAAPPIARGGPRLAFITIAAFLLGALPLPSRLHLPTSSPIPRAHAGLKNQVLGPEAQQVDPMQQPLAPGFPRGWALGSRNVPVPPPLLDPGSSQTQVRVDQASGFVEERYQAGNVEVRPPIVADMLDYNELLSERTYRRVWQERTRSTRSVNKTGLRQGGAFRFELPVQLPKSVRSIVGNGAPRIEVSGSERISILGVSDWVVRGDNEFTGERKRQGAFPSFEMKQELNVNMTGSIGDKIKVDIDQSSNVQTNLDNKVKLRYEGDEDDMIKTIELGNTNLSLQGASLRQDGLFGVKTVAKMGNFDFTVIASKQDAKTETARFTPSGEKRNVRVTDLEYIHRTYYFIADRPVDATDLQLRVFRADTGYQDVNGRTLGFGRIDPTQPADSIANVQVTGYWQELTIGNDYEVLYPYVLDGAPANVKVPIIRLFNQLTYETQLLAVSYVDGGTRIGLTDASIDTTLGKADTTFLLKILKTTPNHVNEDSLGLIDRNGPWFRTVGYELRNYYDLGGREIDPTSLTLKVRRIDNSQATHPDAVTLDGETKPLLTILGLDQREKTSGEFVPDGLVDDQFVNYQTGVLFFPDTHPFAPDTDSSLCIGAGGYNCLDNLRRNRLWTDPNYVNPAVYYDKTPEPGKDERYFIDADFKSSQQGFYLGRFGILEGSEQVKVDGTPMVRDRDYRLDYDTGLITFTRPPGPEQVITVDFSYAPGFGQVQRSLVGLSGGYNPSSNLSFSTSLLREARGAQEQNVKLGEEPANSTLGDFGTVLSFRPVWMTRLADAVPGVTTDQQSALNIQGNFSASLPNPNTKGEAYVDDMEGNRETNTIGLSRLSWFWSSIPVNRRAPGDTTNSVTSVSTLLEDHAGLEWYNPRPDGPTGQREWYLKPVLTQAEGGDNNHQVLELNVEPPAGTPGMDPDDWTGITQSLGTVGQDFSRVRFVELWVNDFTSFHDTTKVFLHLSLGGLSEDAFWSPTAGPNSLLDTEDRNFDGKLDGGCDTDDPNFEDTGLDGVKSPNEPGYEPATNPDPNQDDYTYSVSGPNPDDYSTINRLENNGLCEPNARPDTEDLNRNTLFDTNNNYFEASLDLASTEFVAIDVPSLYAGNEHVRADNGWRLFRIPVSGETFRAVGNPSWQNIQAMRIWLSGIDRPMKIQLGGVEFVGSRWLEAAITDPDMIARDVQLDIRTRNNKDDAGIYVPPYEVQSQIGSNADRREQSLALGYTRMAEGDTLLAFKTLGLPGTGLGWAQYRQIKFYVHGEVGTVESQHLRVLARFGPDTLNFYEYSAPVRGDWQKILIPLGALSQLKELRPRGVNLFIDSTSAASSGEVYSVRGNPSFTNITRLTFGLAVLGSPVGAPAATGEVWIDELRLADVVKESGTSSNVSVQASFADLLALNLVVQKQDQDFFRVGQGGNQGTGLNHSAIGFSTTLNVDRFMPTSNVSLPVRLSVQHATDVPKFRTGSDVTLTGNQSAIETRRLDQQTIDLSYRRSSPVRRGIAKYTLDAINGSMSYSRRAEIQPQSIDSSWAFRAGGGYDLPIGGGGVRLSKKTKINLLPDVVGFSMAWDSRRSLQYSRQIFVDGDSTAVRSDVKTRLLGLGTNASYTPFGSLRMTYNLSSTRDMLVHQEGPLGFNKGTEVSKNQTAQVNYTPRWLSLFNPNVSLKGTYIENSGPELRLSPNDPKGLKNIQNSGIANLDMNLPISRLGGRPKPNRPAGARDTTGGGVSPLAPVRFFFGKLQDIRATFTLDRRATASRVVGDAGLAFKTGFTEVTSPDLDRTLSGSIQTTGRRYTTRLSSAFRPSSALTVDVRADHSLSFAQGQGYAERRTERIQWPDLQGRWVDLHRALRLDRTLTSLTVRSGFTRINDEDGPTEGPLERNTSTDTFGPILGWDLVFRNGVRTSLSSSLTHAVSVDQRAYGVTRDRQSSSTDFRVTKTFPAAKGIRFPFSKKRVRLPNDLNLNLTCNLTGDRQIVQQVGREEYVENDQKGLKVSSGTTYNFSRTISGGFNFEFRQSNDIKNRVKRRGITVDLNAQFSF